MSKILKNITNTPVPDSDYPNSRIKDESSAGAGDGVPVNEAVYGDIIQFFQKLMIDYGVIINDLPDNVTNGYQLIEALEDKIQEKAIEAIPDVPVAAGGYDYIGSTKLPLHSDWSASSTSALFSRERGGLIIVSARVTYTGVSFTSTGLPLAKVSGGKNIFSINDSDLEIKYPSGLTEKYFNVINEMTGGTVIICINSANDVFVVQGNVNQNDVLNLQFSFM